MIVIKVCSQIFITLYFDWDSFIFHYQKNGLNFDKMNALNFEYLHVDGTIDQRVTIAWKKFLFQLLINITITIVAYIEEIYLRNLKVVDKDFSTFNLFSYLHGIIRVMTKKYCFNFN